MFCYLYSYLFLNSMVEINLFLFLFLVAAKHFLSSTLIQTGVRIFSVECCCGKALMLHLPLLQIFAFFSTHSYARHPLAFNRNSLTRAVITHTHAHARPTVCDSSLWSRITSTPCNSLTDRPESLLLVADTVRLAVVVLASRALLLHLLLHYQVY